MVQQQKPLLTIFALLLFVSFATAQQEKPFYYHTIHTHALSATGGRTAKLNYMYQISHIRQFKLSATYVFDSYEQNNNQIDANVINANLQFQYKLINQGKFFLNLAVGGGGYYLTAEDLLGIKHDEWQLNLVGGLQAEFYILRNAIALTVDYDIFYMPWSDIYDFLHVPTAGLTFFFF